MAIRYEVRQQVQTATRKFMETLYSSEYERVMRNEYERLIAEYPDLYFEFLRVESNETCLEFTKGR